VPPQGSDIDSTRVVIHVRQGNLQAQVRGWHDYLDERLLPTSGSNFANMQFEPAASSFG
jgi:hypothetical protein